MNRERVPPLSDPDDEVVADHTMMVSHRPSLPADSLRPGPAVKPARAAVLPDAPDDGGFPDRTMISRRSSLLSDVTRSHQSGPPTDGTVVVARGPGPPTDGTVVVRQSGPPTDGTGVVRPGRPSSGAAMADPVLRGRARRTGASKPPRTIHEERPRYTPRTVPAPPGPPLQVMEGPTALRGTAPLPSVAAASRRGAQAALAVWAVLTAVCAVGAAWCATALFGG